MKVTRNNFYKLDKDFLNDLRTINSYTVYKLNTKEDNLVIVNEKQTHEYLINQFDISHFILRYYYAANRFLVTYKEYEKFVENGFVSRFEYMIQPYNIKIFGAYHNPSRLHFALQSLEMYPHIKIKNKKINYLDDLAPYFIEYSNGFKDGFENFESTEIKSLLNDFSDKTDFFEKIFEFITKKIIFEHSWIDRVYGFSKSGIGKDAVLDYKSGYKDGINNGHFYKAWMIVFSNHNFFSSYFEKIEKEKGNYFDALIPIEKRKIEKVSKTNNEEKPYPRIFKDYYSYSVFKRLYDEFGNKKECLSNYSYVFYKMTYEGLIHFDLLHKTYIEMLSDFDISIDRIKPKGDIGKIAFRDSIYAKAK